MQTAEFGLKLDLGSSEKVLSHMCNILGIRHASDSFIGSHPISLTRAGLGTLLAEDYLVCEKSDGIRIMLIVYNMDVYLYDRNCVLFHSKYRLNVKESYFLDGEMYREEETFVFAAFDCLIFADESCTKRNLNRRLQRTFEFARKIVPSCIMQNTKMQAKSFKIIAKEMMKSYGFYQILNGIPSLRHENDGLIFTPVKDPYLLMQRTRMFKWKPPHLNTVDFYAVKLQNLAEWKLYVSVDERQFSGNRSMYSSGLLHFANYYDDLRTLGEDDFIGEFIYDTSKEVVDMSDFTVSLGGWSLHKVRTDKKEPNNIKTALNVLESVAEGIDEAELRRHWRDMTINYKERNKDNQLAK